MTGVVEGACRHLIASRNIPSMSNNYRPEIDGLRAIAVIPVILFHAGLPVLPGGYVGVDIFFVISGYLITNILLDDIKKDRLSILTFYARRIRRIFPALFLVLLFSLCNALWVMLPNELDEYGESLLATTFFYSNYHFMFDAGYFTAPSETKPLLHMWSLAVEEQFYIAFPIYLYLASRFLRSRLGVITIAVLIVSLVYSVLLVDALPDDAFYSALARAWELMAGSVLALYPRKQLMDSRLANIISAVGIGSILYAILFYSRTTPFPGATALPPVIGASLIIYAGGANQNLVGAALSISVLRFLGLISYSLYLWHWPVLVYYRLWRIGPISNTEIASLIAVIILLSYLSWKYVETPFRTRQLLPRREKIISTGGGVMIVSALFGVTLALGGGFPGRFPERINHILAAKYDLAVRTECGTAPTDTGLELTTCHIGSADSENVVFAVWGDSHGEAVLPGIHASAVKSQTKGIFVGRGGCLPLLDVHQVRQGYQNCTDIANAFMSYLSDHPEIKGIILVSRWAIYAMGERFKNEKGHTVYIRDSDTKSHSLDENRRAFRRAFERTLARLASLGRRIIIVEQVPETEFNIPLAAARALLLKRNMELRPLVNDYVARQAYVSEVIDSLIEKYSVILIRPQAVMCGNNYCSVFNEGIPIYRDTNHITNSYAEKMAAIFDPVLSRIQIARLHQ